MTPTIQIEIRSVYGQEHAYPINDAAKTMARIAGTKTLTRFTIGNSLLLGCIVELVYQGQVVKVYQGARPYANLPNVA